MGGLLLLHDEIVGDEVGHLQQVVVLGVSEGRTADDPFYWDVLRHLAVLPDLVLTGHGCATREAAVEPPDRSFPTFVKDWVGIASVRSEGFVDAVE